MGIHRLGGAAKGRWGVEQVLKNLPGPLRNVLNGAREGEVLPTTGMHTLDVTTEVNQPHPHGRLILVETGQSDDESIGTIVANKHETNGSISPMSTLSGAGVVLAKYSVNRGGVRW